MMDDINMNEYIKNVGEVPILKFKKTSSVCNVKSTKNNFFVPFQEDKLFWIYYYIVNGYLKYNLATPNYYEIEVNNKINIIDEIKKNRSLLKEKKIKNIKDIENELLCNKEINFNTFIIICIIFKINILYLRCNVYYKLINEDSNDLYIIHLINNIYSCEKSSINNLSYYEENRYNILSYDKPLLCQSAYKLDEIMNICKLLKIDICEDGKKIKKNDLYMLIKEKLNILYKIEK
jgi:hypothetical protein